MKRDAGGSPRAQTTTTLSAGFVVVGGGMAGVCASITAARAGIDVVLVQDRPVLGGNASSEVRLWINGATSHMGNNNRWSREGGVIDEILVENLYRNAEGNALILDALLLEKVVREPRIRLLLNTSIDRVDLADDGSIAAVSGYCSQNQTRYVVRAPLYCDSSGDGIVGFLAGAPFRMGAEGRDEFDEPLAPPEEYGELLGHSLYFYSKDTGRPVPFVAPDFALKDITRIPHYRRFNTSQMGCQLWWLEFGGRLDTIHQTEEIKWELWRIAYGVWDYIKNSGEFPDAETLTLEWIGAIPGKRESRRFEGDYILTQDDILEQRTHPDAVSVGGWAIDLHPADGVYSPLPSCTQWHANGVYQVPYRCMYSRNVPNLFLGGRLISVSHVAFGSTRVMATCAHNGQAVGMAAAICVQEGLGPRGLTEPERMQQLQQKLLRSGQYVPGVELRDEEDHSRAAAPTATSRFILGELLGNGQFLPLDVPRAMLIPIGPGRVPRFGVRFSSDRVTQVSAKLRLGASPGNFTPDRILSRTVVPVPRTDGDWVWIDFETSLDESQYAFVCLSATDGVSLELSDQRLTGVLALSHRLDRSVAKSSVQEAPPEARVPRVEFWLPGRRPGGHNWAFRIDPPLDLFGPANAINGKTRPTMGPNAWVADPDDRSPTLTLRWDAPRSISTVVVTFDTDLDHPLESVLRGHPERELPSCVKGFRLRDETGRLIGECAGNHHTRAVMTVGTPAAVRELHLEITETRGWPAAVFAIACY